ncbi:MAG: molybdenum ABC transporter ATP-binding protein [Rhodospirillales bacterium]|nr:molybdenum ABC transporter ATP-binding protein [Rhodospirillales bacterium]
MPDSAPAKRLEVAVRLRFDAFSLQVTLDRALTGITALFGPSGGGKSSLLRILAGLERRAEGRVAFDGSLWSDSSEGYHLAAHRRPVGMVFQDARLFAHLNVAGNLRFAERRSRHREIVYGWEEVVQALDLSALLGRAVTALSGGERQRVALARTLLTRPRLLLLDEPLSALDLGRKADILPYLEAVPRRFGIPTLYVSHALDEVAQIADEVVVLVEGLVKAAGPIAQIMERPNLQAYMGRFEAGSLIEAVVSGQDTRFNLTELRVGAQILAMPMVSFLNPGDPVRLRVRARDVALATAQPSGLSIRNALRGKVLAVVEEEETAFAEVLLDIGGSHLQARITRASVADLGLKPGLSVFALIKSTTFDRRAIARRQIP